VHAFGWSARGAGGHSGGDPLIGSRFECQLQAAVPYGIVFPSISEPPFQILAADRHTRDIENAAGTLQLSVIQIDSSPLSRLIEVLRHRSGSKASLSRDPKFNRLHRPRDLTSPDEHAFWSTVIATPVLGPVFSPTQAMAPRRSSQRSLSDTNRPNF
jgi:hypothetical protein